MATAADAAVAIYDLHRKHRVRHHALPRRDNELSSLIIRASRKIVVESSRVLFMRRMPMSRSLWQALAQANAKALNKSRRKQAFVKKPYIKWFFPAYKLSEFFK